MSVLPEGLTRAVRSAEQRLLRAARHRSALASAQRAPIPWSTRALRDHDYCLLITFRRSGAAVPTPVWFGLANDNLYLRSAASDGKLKRIAHTPRVLIAPCDGFGKPQGEPMEGRARILKDTHETAEAERSIRDRYGVARRLYGLTRALVLDAVYVEVTTGERPAPPDFDSSTTALTRSRERT
jgi:PPOX class probable F420-dependent enzyme